MKKIILVGALYTGNVGDDIIVDIVEKSLSEFSSQPMERFSISGKTRRISNNNAKMLIIKRWLKNRWLYQLYVNHKRKRRLTDRLSKINWPEISCVIFVGGQMFFDVFVPLIELIVKKCEANSVKVIFNACGFGPLNRDNRMRLNRVLSYRSVIGISTREDPHNCISPLDSNITKKIKHVWDPALMCSEYYPVKRKEKGCVIGIGLINPLLIKKRGNSISETEYKNMINDIIGECENRGYKVSLFCTGDLTDYYYIKEFSMNCNAHPRIEKYPESIKDFVEMINTYDAIISFRLHSHIIAASYRIPSFGLAWDNKVFEFFKYTHREECCISLKNGYDKNDLFNRIKLFFDNDYSVDFSQLLPSNDVLKKCISAHL